MHHPATNHRPAHPQQAMVAAAAAPSREAVTVAAVAVICEDPAAEPAARCAEVGTWRMAVAAPALWVACRSTQA